MLGPVNRRAVFRIPSPPKPSCPFPAERFRGSPLTNEPVADQIASTFLVGILGPEHILHRVAPERRIRTLQRSLPFKNGERRARSMLAPFPDF